MATPPVLDFEKLLARISEDQPTGTWLRSGSQVEIDLYSAIKDAADASRTSERKLRVADPNDQNTIPAPPEWKKVSKLAQEALATKSKDLWIAAWLIEALTREHGFGGLRDGFRLARELSENYWGALHPPVDPDDLEHGDLTTVIALAGLNGVDSEGVLLTPLSDAIEKQIAQLQTQRGTSSDAYKNLLEDVNGATAELEKMSAVLTERCQIDGSDRSPPTSALRDRLELCLRRIREVAGDLVDDSASKETIDDELGNNGSSSGQAPHGAPVAAGGSVRTREQAFQQLNSIADFFQKTEPHSPVSYALRQVVRWGKMALPQLLSELIDEAGTRQQLFRLTGIPWKEETPSES